MTGGPGKGVLLRGAALSETTCFSAQEAGDLCGARKGEELFASSGPSGLGVTL